MMTTQLFVVMANRTLYKLGDQLFLFWVIFRHGQSMMRTNIFNFFPPHKGHKIYVGNKVCFTFKALITSEDDNFQKKKKKN